MEEGASSRVCLRRRGSSPEPQSGGEPAIVSVILPSDDGAVRDIDGRLVADALTGTGTKTATSEIRPGQPISACECTLCFDFGAAGDRFHVRGIQRRAAIRRKNEKGMRGCRDTPARAVLPLSGVQDGARVTVSWLSCAEPLESDHSQSIMPVREPRKTGTGIRRQSRIRPGIGIVRPRLIRT
jgi:hypothetical protein